MGDRYNSKIAYFIGKLNDNPRYAVTISSTCTLYSVPESEVHERWRRHEDCHKKQIADEGWLKFMAKYLFFNITRGYKNNPYEIQARLAE